VGVLSGKRQREKTGSNNQGNWGIFLMGLLKKLLHRVGFMVK
jgi:hypothetical protein